MQQIFFISNNILQNYVHENYNFYLKILANIWWWKQNTEEIGLAKHNHNIMIKSLFPLHTAQ